MRVGVLITTWNRSPQLRQSLERMTHMTIPDDVLVVDDGGDDGCDQVCHEFVGRLPIRYIYTHNPGLSLCSHSRNVGLKNTDVDLLVVSEPEMWFITDVVAQMVARYRSELAAGRRQVVSAGIVYHAQHPHMTTWQEANRLEGWVAPYVMLVARGELLSVGGWNEFDMPGEWGFDDIDLLTRLRINGCNQFIDREIEAFHQYHDNPGRDQVGALVNDAWWKEQNLEERYKTDPIVIIANKGRDWGEVKQR